MLCCSNLLPRPFCSPANSLRLELNLDSSLAVNNAQIVLGAGEGHLNFELCPVSFQHIALAPFASCARSQTACLCMRQVHA